MYYYFIYKNVGDLCVRSTHRKLYETHAICLSLKHLVHMRIIRKCFVEYCQSCKTVLWIWIRFCYCVNLTYICMKWQTCITDRNPLVGIQLPCTTRVPLHHADKLNAWLFFCKQRWCQRWCHHCNKSQDAFRSLPSHIYYTLMRKCFHVNDFAFDHTLPCMCTPWRPTGFFLSFTQVLLTFLLCSFLTLQIAMHTQYEGWKTKFLKP